MAAAIVETRVPSLVRLIVGRNHQRVTALAVPRIRMFNLVRCTPRKGVTMNSIFDAPQTAAPLPASKIRATQAIVPSINSSALKAKMILACAYFPPPLMNLNDLMAQAPRRKITQTIAEVCNVTTNLQDRVLALKAKNAADSFSTEVIPALNELFTHERPARPITLQNPHAAVPGPSEKKEETKVTSPATLPLWKQIDHLFTKIFSLLKDLHSVVETDAAELHSRIKTRTEHLKRLSTLVQKINTVPPGQSVDWSKDPEMKALLDEARALGVEIEKGKYAFSEKELEHLKENTQIVRDRFEKLTQTERADLQRYLQEASQYLQFISNLLKKVETVGDTLSRNVRPG